MNGTSVYAGVAYDGEGNVYADYNNSTEHLQVDDLLSRFIKNQPENPWSLDRGMNGVMS